MPRWFVLPVLATAVAMVLAACGDTTDGGDGGRIRVVASTSIVADWANEVGKDLVSVETLVPPGADAHTFQLGPGAVRNIAEADVTFMVGAGLEAGFEGIVKENAGGPVVELARDLATGTTAEGETDPHIWMDPELARQAVARMADELAAVDGANAATYRANADRYELEIDAMEARIEGQLANIPPERKLMVTFHDAYGYFAQRFGLTILGFVVENPEEEPSASRIADLVDEMRRTGANVIYVEPQFSARVVEQVAAETGAEVREIPSDTLSGEYPTYIAMMETIAERIAA